jgi:putative endonuclease
MSPEKVATPWFVYVLRCRDGSLYTGVTTDVAARLAAHNDGQGARYTRGRGPVELVYVEPQDDRGAALRREAAIKRLSRAAKARLVGDRVAPARRLAGGGRSAGR